MSRNKKKRHNKIKIINGIKNIELLKKIYKKLYYFYIIMFLPLIFINDDFIIMSNIMQIYADYIGKLFAHVEVVSVYAKSIGGQYYTIKFIYSYLFFITIFSFIYLLYIHMNIYLYSLNIIKNTKYNIEIISIKETGSWHHFIVLLIPIFLLVFLAYYWISDSDSINDEGKFSTVVFTYKYIAILISGITSFMISFFLSITIIDIFAKIYSKNFRIFEPLKEEEKKIFTDTKKVLLRKKNIFSFIILLVFLILYGIIELMGIN
jgi:hypothetical protein